jgi:flavodoxin
MNAKVFYATKTGNTKKIAEAMAAALGVVAANVSDAAIVDAAITGGEKLDCAFVGGAVYATHDHDFPPELRAFLVKLAKAGVRLVVPFGTYAFKDSVSLLGSRIGEAGLPLSSESFSCRGKFLFFNRKSPTPKDLADAAAFAKRISLSSAPR